MERFDKLIPGQRKSKTKKCLGGKSVIKLLAKEISTHERESSPLLSGQNNEKQASNILRIFEAETSQGKISSRNLPGALPTSLGCVSLCSTNEVLQVAVMVQVCSYATHTNGRPWHPCDTCFIGVSRNSYELLQHNSKVTRSRTLPPGFERKVW
jgi:hypothetical protein